ncbi:MAG: shikimate dehydrogenase [Cyanobacteria bacterium]|nr:shikimate dehydrogenase [Cyanobacteriota bacterium]
MPSKPQQAATSTRPGPGGSTALAGVLGDPVHHSLSPAIHNAALAELGLDWVYLALPVRAADLAAVVPTLEALDCRGLSVTIPHKRAVTALVDELSPLAQRLGAVNTLVRRPQGGWLGTNTDVEGFLAPLRNGNWQGSQAVVLGSGGSALAVLAALEQLGFGSIAVAGRNASTLAAFQADCRHWLPGLETLAWTTADEEPLLQALALADLVVNCTPVGMTSTSDPTAVNRSPLSAAALDRLRPSCGVYDLIYTPRPTALLRGAEERGCRTWDGLEMLVQQGAAGLRLWSGLNDVPIATMREAALARLQAP